MNWGKSIVLTFIIFAGLIITMVVISMNHDVNLVAPNYYEEELAYQDQIDRIQNYKNLVDKPSIERTGNQIVLTFPPELGSLIENGELHFFRPSDHSVDRKIALKLNDQNQQSFSTTAFKKGLWKTKLKWVSDGKEYFFEKKIVL